MNVTWDEAVAYARSELGNILHEIEEIEGSMSRHQMDVLKILENLSRLSTTDLSWQQEAQALGGLVREDLKRARRRGLAQEGISNENSGSYLSFVTTVISDAAKNPAAFNAAEIHAANLISTNTPLCYELRTFVCDVLRRTIECPGGRKPRVHPVRDAVLYAFICDLAERFKVRPTKNSASHHLICACDILAEAMPNRADLPKSPSSLQRIWLQGKRNEQSELEDDQLDPN